MSHPLMYVLGDTEKKDFPLVLTIGREPNYDDVLSDEIGIIDLNEFSSMSGGVWVTAYTQYAKQYIGENGTSGYLKRICFEKNASPVVFTNAFPIGIPQQVSDKHAIRKRLINVIPQHIEKLFSKEIINRVKLVVHHGADETEPSVLAKKLIQGYCAKLGIVYCSTAFFYNGNSKRIQSSLKPVSPLIQELFREFSERT